MTKTTKKKAIKKKASAKPVPHRLHKQTKTSGKKPISKKATSKKTVATKTKSIRKKTAGNYGLPETLRDAALKILDERKAENVVVVDARGRSAMTDYIIVASGGSSRQLAAIADYLRQAFTENGVTRIRTEGLPQGDWVLIDAGDVVTHLFRPEVRRYYAIEDIWKKTHEE